MSHSLHELTASYRHLETLNDGDVSEEEFFQAIDLIDGEIKEKAKNIAKFIENLGAEAEMIEQAAERMLIRAKSKKNRIASIKTYLLRNMQSLDIYKIECEYFLIKRVKNPPKVVIHDETKVPLEYLRQPEPPPPAPDNKLILAEMKQGVVVDGCELVQEERLDIK